MIFIDIILNLKVRILDLCTGTATNAITIAKEKANAKIITEANRILKDGGEILEKYDLFRK